jgi:hypothetical protein
MTPNLSMTASTMDEPLSLSVGDQKDIERRVDDIIAESLRQKDPVIALRGISQMEGFTRIVGDGLAKALWELKANWSMYELEEDFYDFVLEHSSLAKATIDRYILTWEMFHNKCVPEKLVSQIKSRTMRDQIEIAKIADRVELGDKDWKEIAACSNGHELILVKRKLLDMKPRKSGVTLRLRRSGDIEAYDSAGKKHFIGSLELDQRKTDEVVDKAINRIVRGGGLLEE